LSEALQVSSYWQASVGISEFGSLGVSTPHLVMVLFGTFLVYSVAIFVVTPHSFVTLHHHELVRPRLGRDFPQLAHCFIFDRIC